MIHWPIIHKYMTKGIPMHFKISINNYWHEMDKKNMVKGWVKVCKPSHQNPLLVLYLSSYFVIKGKILQHCTSRDSYQYANTPLEEQYNLLSFSNAHYKGDPSPWRDLPATIGRSLWLCHWRLQPWIPLWTTFHNISYWISLTQNIKWIGHISSYFHTQPTTIIQDQYQITILKPITIS